MDRRTPSVAASLPVRARMSVRTDGSAEARRDRMTENGSGTIRLPDGDTRAHEGWRSHKVAARRAHARSVWPMLAHRALRVLRPTTRPGDDRRMTRQP